MADDDEIEYMCCLPGCGGYTTLSKLSVCSRCKSVSARYCSKACQEKDWVEHKQVCKSAEEQEKHIKINELLLIAAERGQLKGITTLIMERGANVNYFGRDGLTALMVAAQNEDDVAVAHLLRLGADVNVISTDQYRSTALALASQNGNTAVVQVLLAAGANVNYFGSMDGGSAVLLACQNNHPSTVRLLIKAGADINRPNTLDSSAPLTIASFRGNVEVVEILIEAGADINYVRKDSATALILAR